MHNGQRRELSTIMPLSTENASTGKPAICHALIFTASPKVLVNEGVSEHGIFFALHNAVQSFTHSLIVQNDIIHHVIVSR